MHFHHLTATWPRLPFPPIEFFAVLFFLPPNAIEPNAANLLEEERHIGRLALVPDRACPLWRHRAGFLAARILSAGDDPMDSCEVERADVFEQRLTREEPDARRDRPQHGDPA